MKKVLFMAHNSETRKFDGDEESEDDEILAAL